jgi:hypothetical protein
MKCSICKQECRPESTDAGHHLERVMDTCLGCFEARVDLELFLVRASGGTPMGAWTDGWLREIIADPARHLDYGDRTGKV